MLYDLLTVARKEILDILGHKLTAVLTLGVSAYMGILAPRQFLEIQQTRLTDLQSVFDLYLGFFFLAAALTGSWGFTIVPFMLEKTRRTLETLLTTPLSLRVIWSGKALAVFMLCYPLAFIYSLIVILYLNLAVGTARFVLPSPVGWLIIFVLAPIMVYSIIALNGLVQMILNQPQVGQFVTLGLIFLVYRIGTHFAAEPRILLVVGYLFGILTMVLLTAVTLRFLTKERIVLSIG